MTAQHRREVAAAASGGELEHLEYGVDAGARAGEVLAALGARGTVAVLADTVPKPTGDGDLLEIAVAAVRRAGYDVARATPCTGPHGVVLDESTVDEAAAALAGAGAVVSVGSGTVTDLAKAATPTGVPLVAVQSAPSVNGYADPLSVLVRGGAKSTVPTRWPNALLVDAGALEHSPDLLVGAGVGDAVAVASSVADWVLAARLGAGGPADPAVLADLLGAVADLRTGRSADGSMTALVDALTYGGLSIGVVGSTAPLSGCEHLTSHILDMAAMAADAPHDLHGRQVGVATVLSTALWQEALERDLVRIDDATAFPDDVEHRVERTWRVVDPTGRLGATCRASVGEKVAAWEQGRATRRPLDDAFLDRLRALLRPPEEVAATLRAWGAPTRFGELEPAVAPERARWVLSALPFMRNRVTLADLLVMNDAWDDDLLDAVLDRAARAGGGA
ncbi:iron-containing alcohol dehydrogenase [Georgenia sp. Z1491]|uniref:iron-containing alcohol dehydrogenase n=1 Tax=Georgenia sp. Z1491 TaxID=3416707 RepID=UPI003CF74712